MADLRKRQRATRRGLVVVALTATTVSVHSPIAEAATPNPPIVVELDLDIVRDVHYVEANDRVVIAGDDEAQIFTIDGAHVATVDGISGAIDPESNGTLAVVGAPGTGELVVIDTETGAVERRIHTGAQFISSLEVVGDVIWYAHGPSDNGSGFGKASITAGTATNAHVEARRIGPISVSANRPSSIYMTPTGVSPADIRRHDEGVDNVHGFDSPYHETFRPVMVAEDASRVFAGSGGTVIEMNPDTLERLAFFYEAPEWSQHYTNDARMAAHDSTRIAYARGPQVVTWEVGTPSISTDNFYASGIVDVDLSATQIIALESGKLSYAGDPTVARRLVITDFAVAPPGSVISFIAVAAGDLPPTGSTISYDCDNESGEFTADYAEVAIQIEVSPLTQRCTFRRSWTPSTFVSGSYFDLDSETWVQRDWLTITITGNPDADVVIFGDAYPLSSYTVATPYDRDDYANVLAAANYLGMDVATFQKTGVHVLRFINALAGNIGPAPLGADAPVMAGDLVVESVWPDDDFETLWWVEDYYRIDNGQAQRVGATLLYFLASIDARNNGTPLPAG